MALYHVRARFREEKRAEFLQALTDGTVAALKPFGEEVAASMRRAVLGDADRVEWTETCYCPTPLLQERAAVYDDYFDAIEAEAVANPPALTGASFWAYLKG